MVDSEDMMLVLRSTILKSWTGDILLSACLGHSIAIVLALISGAVKRVRRGGMPGPPRVG